MGEKDSTGEGEDVMSEANRGERGSLRRVVIG